MSIQTLPVKRYADQSSEGQGRPKHADKTPSVNVGMWEIYSWSGIHEQALQMSPTQGYKITELYFAQSKTAILQQTAPLVKLL